MIRVHTRPGFITPGEEVVRAAKAVTAGRTNAADAEDDGCPDRKIEARPVTSRLGNARSRSCPTCRCFTSRFITRI